VDLLLTISQEHEPCGGSDPGHCMPFRGATSDNFEKANSTNAKQYIVFCPFSNKSYAHGTFKSTVISHHHVTFRIRIVESWEQRPLPLHYQPGH
jgi:hypothetical protein